MHRLLNGHLVERITSHTHDVRHGLQHVAPLTGGTELKLSLPSLSSEPRDLLFEFPNWSFLTRLLKESRLVVDDLGAIITELSLTQLTFIVLLPWGLNLWLEDNRLMWWLRLGELSQSLCLLSWEGIKDLLVFLEELVVLLERHVACLEEHVVFLLERHVVDLLDALIVRSTNKSGVVSLIWIHDE